MARTNNTSQWEEPKFSFSAANQAEEWKTYIWALDHLKTLDINMDDPSQAKKRLKPIKIMFTGKDGQAL